MYTIDLTLSAAILHRHSHTIATMRVSDLLPTQWGIYVFLFFLGVGCILGLGYACWVQPGLAIFNPAQPGNIVAWFSAVLWFFAALVCLTAFQVDRYTHSYRLSDIWLWAAFGCLLLSVDSACQVRYFLRDLLVQVSGTALYGNGDVWWISIYLLLFGMIGSRLLVEMRHHLLSCNLFFVAALSQILACCIALNLFDLPGKETLLPVLLRSGLEMLGAFFAAFSFSLFVRKMVLQLDSPKQVTTPKVTPQKVSPQKTPPKSKEKEKKKEEEKENVKIIDPKPEKKSKRSGPSRTCPIVFPAQGGEKIVKVEKIEPLSDGETLEKLKKPKKKAPPHEEEREDLEDFEDDTGEDNEDTSLEEEYEEEEYDQYDEMDDEEESL